MFVPEVDAHASAVSQNQSGGDFGSGAAAVPLIRSASPEGRDGDRKDRRDGEKFLIPKQKTPVIIII